MRLLLLVNTSASSVTPRARVVIQKALAADHDVHVAETSRRGHATRLALGAAADGVEVVVALGGGGGGWGRGGARGRPTKPPTASQARAGRWLSPPAARRTCSPARSAS